MKLPFKEFRTLVNIVGEDCVSAREADLIHYTYDCSARSLIQLRYDRPLFWPQAIVWPKSTDQVMRIVNWASRRKIPLVAFGGGSGVSGGVIPIRGGVVVDLKKMDQVESINPRKPDAIVQSGINCFHLEECLQGSGYTLGHFPDSMKMATLGGCVASRSVGQFSSKYGTIEDMVDSVEAVLPNGELVPLGAKQIPNMRGMTPLSLFAGSEGTLGIITRLRIRLHRKAQGARYRGISFIRLSDGIATMRKMMQVGLRPSVLRFYDRFESILLQMDYEKNVMADQTHLLTHILQPLKVSALNPFGRAMESFKNRTLHRVLSYPRVVDFLAERIPASHILILGFEGDPEIAAAEEAEALRICKENLSRDEGSNIGWHWQKKRFSEFFKIPELFRQGNFIDTIEVASTWDRLEDLYTRVRRAIARHCFVMVHLTHACLEGCSIYFTFVGRESVSQGELKIYDRVWCDAIEACLQVGGTITHHRGVGMLKAKYMSRELGPLMNLFKNIKQTLDPNNIMNPGKMGL